MRLDGDSQSVVQRNGSDPATCSALGRAALGTCVAAVGVRESLVGHLPCDTASCQTSFEVW